MMTRRWFAPLAAVLAVGVSGCSVYDAPLPGGADPGKDPMEVTVKFRDVLDLVPQSNVKLDDVTIGKVSRIRLDGYTARVTIKIPKDIDLPDNVRADIRQTSLLGEKFISLSKPDQPRGRLQSKDTIGLAQTGRNPEVEEVLGALSALLNGGGVAQLKTIAHELNIAFDGREGDVRSLIRELGSFMGQLDSNKGAIVTALENVNRLALELRRHDPTIKATLDKIPAALVSLDRQRDDLTRLLAALDRLSSVGVDVIQASKAGTISSLKSLSPILNELAKAGSDLPNSLQLFLTFPFPDATVGLNPQKARNLQMGDFVNLSARLNLDLGNLPGLPGLPTGVENLNALLASCQDTPLDPLCQQISGLLGALAGSAPTLPGAKGTTGAKSSPAPGTSQPAPELPDLSGALDSGASGSSPDPIGSIIGGLGLGRPAPSFDLARDPFVLGPRGVDPALGTLLLQGVAYQ